MKSDAIDKARKSLQVADHMAYVTYNVVREPRILLSILENVFLAYANAMNALLEHERMYKRIPAYADNFESKLDAYRRVEARYKLKPEYSLIMKDIKDTLYAHKRSPMEFRRDDRFVICSEDYRMKAITLADMKGYISKAKLFIQETGELIR